jgi:hypothetical protein
MPGEGIQEKSAAVKKPSSETSTSTSVTAPTPCPPPNDDWLNEPDSIKTPQSSKTVQQKSKNKKGKKK